MYLFFDDDAICGYRCEEYHSLGVCFRRRDMATIGRTLATLSHQCGGPTQPQRVRTLPTSHSGLSRVNTETFQRVKLNSRAQRFLGENALCSLRRRKGCKCVAAISTDGVCLSSISKKPLLKEISLRSQFNSFSINVLVKPRICFNEIIQNIPNSTLFEISRSTEVVRFPRFPRFATTFSSTVTFTLTSPLTFLTQHVRPSMLIS
jgi:hypothetical protein